MRSSITAIMRRVIQPAHDLVAAQSYDNTVSLGISDKRVVRVLKEVVGASRSITWASSESASFDAGSESYS